MIVALALPWPRVSRPSALSTAPVRGVVLLDEGGLALVLRGDRADLDLHDARGTRRPRPPGAGRRACTGRCSSTSVRSRHASLDRDGHPERRWSAPSLEVLHGVDVAGRARGTVPPAPARAARASAPARPRRPSTGRQGPDLGGQPHGVAPPPVVGGDRDRAAPMAGGDGAPRRRADAAAGRPSPTTTASWPRAGLPTGAP